jgi:integrase
MRASSSRRWAAAPWTATNLAARHFKPLLKRAGLPDIRLYELRHTFATLWLESGEHPKVLQEILRHSRISVTLDTYSHVIPHMQRDAMSRFGKMFAKPS